MKKKFFLTESEKSSIRNLYGLLNEEKGDAFDCLRKAFGIDFVIDDKTFTKPTVSTSAGSRYIYFYEDGTFYAKPLSASNTEKSITGTWKCLGKNNVSVQSKDEYFSINDKKWVLGQNTNTSMNNKANVGGVSTNSENRDFSSYAIQSSDTEENVIINGEKVITFGSKGDLVKKVQQKLSNYYKELAPKISKNPECANDYTKCDGIFGKNTMDAAKKFQIEKQLRGKKNGVIGKITYPEIMKL